jgi:hypothetical protein
VTNKLRASQRLTYDTATVAVDSTTATFRLPEPVSDEGNDPMSELSRCAIRGSLPFKQPRGQRGRKVSLQAVQDAVQTAWRAVHVLPANDARIAALLPRERPARWGDMLASL